MSSPTETRNKFYAELHALPASEPTTCPEPRDAQGGHPVDVDARNGDLDSENEAAPVEKPGKLGRHRPGQTNVEESATIFGANHITAAAKSKRETHKSQLSHSSPPPPPPPPQNDNAKSSPTCPQFQRAFCTPIGLFGHLRSDGGTLTAATLVSPSHDIN
ncbi:hypothetical protein SprV_1002840800 [Sparganum proliferum]